MEILNKVFGSRVTEEQNTKRTDNPPSIPNDEPTQDTKKGVNPIWVTWKVQVGRDMSNKIKRVYRDKGFGTHSELVRYLLRQWMESVKE